MSIEEEGGVPLRDYEVLYRLIILVRMSGRESKISQGEPVITLLACSLYLRVPLRPQPENGLILSLDGNSQKNHNNRSLVISSICEQLAVGEKNITGVVIAESNINEGRQDVPAAGLAFDTFYE